MTDFPWTAEAVAQLELLWRNGASASVCACELTRQFDCSVTRNAVIGKAARLGLNKKYPHARVPARRTVRRMPRVRPAMINVRSIRAAFRPARSMPAPKPVVVAIGEPTPLRLVLAQLRRSSCRWPLGDPRASCFAFCGCERPTVTLLGKPEPDPSTFYCSFHTELARAS